MGKNKKIRGEAFQKERGRQRGVGLINLIAAIQSIADSNNQRQKELTRGNYSFDKRKEI